MSWEPLILFSALAIILYGVVIMLLINEMLALRDRCSALEQENIRLQRRLGMLPRSAMREPPPDGDGDG